MWTDSSSLFRFLLGPQNEVRARNGREADYEVIFCLTGLKNAINTIERTAMMAATMK
jgi:hypothetical protein